MNFKYFIVAIALIGTICSCKDKEEREEFSYLTPEQHKENLVQSGQSVVADLNGLSDLNGVHALIDFFDLIDKGSSKEPISLLNTVKPLALYAGQKNKLILKSADVDSYKFSGVYENEKGVYEYNPLTGEFDHTPTDDDIVFNFPIGTSTTNNGTLALTDLHFTEHTYTDFDGAIVELPLGFDITLTSGSTELMSLKFEGAYDSNGIPTLTSMTYKIDDYTITAKITKSNSEIVIAQTFTKLSQNILSTKFSSKGDFSYNNITDTQDLETPADQDVISSINTYIAIGNYKVEGNASWAGMETALKNMREDNSTDEQKRYEDLAIALNENVKLTVKYFDTNEIIAQGGFYAYEHIDEYWNESWWDINMSMKFADGSEIDDSYFADGFSALITDVEDLMSDMDTSYGR